MEKKPKILVTNDDGIFAPGIRALVEVMKELGDVLIVAPDRPQSGMGHAITVSDVLRLRKVDFEDGVEAYSCSGTPVDCVKLAIYKVLKRRPDLLVSGINHGPNHSISVLYSGTMSAAVEGAIESIPSIGFSAMTHSMAYQMSETMPMVRAVAKSAIKNGIPDGTCLNVNIPAVKAMEMKGIKICRQAKAAWEDDFDVRTDPFGSEYYWLSGEFKSYDKGEDTDVWALDNNYVSVVPIQYDMTAHHDIVTLNNWDL